LPFALVSSVSSIGGAMLGLVLPVPVVQTALGILILAIVALMASSKDSLVPRVGEPDALSRALHLSGIYRDGKTGEEISWHAHRTPLGLVLFFFIGIIAGMFGLGAGWANVPALNLVMGVPLKVAVGTSSFVISPAAALVYLNKGALLPMIAAPSVAGMMLGSTIGARMLNVVSATAVRRLVVALMLFAGVRTLGKGLGWW